MRDPFATPPHHFPQIWLLFASLALLGLAVLHDLRLLQPVFALDRSHVTALIASLVIAGSVHAVWHVSLYSRRMEAARQALSNAERVTGKAAILTASHDPYIAAWMTDIERMRHAAPEHRAELYELYADRLRSPVDLGWFLVDVTIRLGLLGTILGFILIFTSLSGLSIDGAEGLRDLLVAMSGGMGTALFTTLAGLIGATLLSVQYLILGRQAEHLLGLLSRYRSARQERAQADAA